MEVIASISAGPGFDAALGVHCALLRDVIEDTPTTFEQVSGVFGRAVADGVLALTKYERLPDKQARMEDSLRRIRKLPRGVWRVRLADRITNLQPPPSYWTPEKKAKYRSEAVMILDALGEASVFLATRLRRKIEAYGEFF